MMGSKDNLDTTVEQQTELLLKQLMHLKQYEKPETARMTRNKQNIMRMVRQANGSKRKSLGDLLEINMPWLFAEPKYGVALLFVAFVGLQYAGINARHESSTGTGIYAPSTSLVAVNSISTATNSISYPKFPDNVALFPQGNRSSDIKFVGRIEK
ncbi:hypothetical protein [Pontiella sulfatireligans]|uniref:Uncharacterized protein n=1 Tax=Pontiella sulfatireligans TaxID=2750658 RepID=A0A6C2UR74_9BACT|nr:hypothetical protein [Pontiella sulfatireligans]VGO22738.1 hypothetical protein SCARR_04834 [Pontiella sulfatireligans]